NGRGVMGPCTGNNPVANCSSYLHGSNWHLEGTFTELGSSSYFKVASGSLDAFDTNEWIYFMSNVVNIPTDQCASFKVDLSENDNLGTSDKRRVEYRIDGGSW